MEKVRFLACPKALRADARAAAEASRYPGDAGSSVEVVYEAR